MGKLIYAANISLDGFLEDETGSFDWSVPDEDVHAFWNEHERHIGTSLYGRRMYQTMRVWVGCVLSEAWVLSKQGASWHLLGGGGGSAEDDLLATRPIRLPEYLGQPEAADTGIDPRLIAIDSSGGVHDGQGGADRWPWSGRWIRHVVRGGRRGPEPDQEGH
jgi:hypothetical protein